jgi:hypothetical protein
MLRMAGAGLLIAAGATHLDLYLTGYRTIPTIGWLFLLQVIAAFGLGLAVLAIGGRRDALAVQLIPDLPGSVPFAAVLIDAQDLLFQRGVVHRSGRRRPRPGRVVSRRRDRHAGLAQRPADRPDPELVPAGPR